MASVLNVVPIRKTSYAQAEDALTVARALRGDESAFAKLFGKYSTRVFRTCLRMVNDASIAEDLTQETFLHVYRRLSTFRAESLFSTWLHRIAVNAALMHIRKYKAHPEQSLEAPTEDDGEAKPLQWMLSISDKELTRTPERVALQKAVDALPEGYRTVFLLHDVHGYEHHEIADLLGCTIGNTKSQLHKARRKLRDTLTETRALRLPSEVSMAA